MNGQDCERCGAALAAEGGCAYCGAPVIVAPGWVAPVAVAPAPPEPTVEELLREFRRSSDYDRLARPGSVDAPLPWRRLPAIVVGLGFVVISLSMISFHRTQFSDPFFDGSRSTFEVLPLLFVMIGAGFAGWHIVAMWKASVTPVVPVAAYVVSKRTHTAGGQQNVATTYHVGLETVTGSRREVEALPHAWSSLREDEIGVAFLRGRELVGFRRAPAVRR